MARTGYPVVFDVTHSVQQPGGQGTTSGGQREFAPDPGAGGGGGGGGGAVHRDASGSGPRAERRAEHDPVAGDAGADCPAAGVGCADQGRASTLRCDGLGRAGAIGRTLRCGRAGMVGTAGACCAVTPMGKAERAAGLGQYHRGDRERGARAIARCRGIVAAGACASPQGQDGRWRRMSRSGPRTPSCSGRVRYAGLQSSMRQRNRPARLVSRRPLQRAAPA